MKFSRLYSRSSRNRFILPVLLLYILFQTTPVFTQENFPIGTRAAALANAVVMDSGIWSVYHNQAGLAQTHNLILGFHHENKFLIKEHALHAMALVVPVKSGSFGFSYTYYGFNLYNASKLGIAFGKSFGEKFSAGVQMNYHYIYISPEYLSGDNENLHAVSVEGGIQYTPIPAIRIGMHVYNPSRAILSPTNLDTLETTVRAGLSYSPVSKLWLALETQKSLDSELRIKSGIEYQINDGLFIRTGIITKPVQNTFGLGFKIKRINADVAFSHHPVLGFTPHFSMEVRLK